MHSISGNAELAYNDAGVRLDLLNYALIYQSVPRLATNFTNRCGVHRCISFKEIRSCNRLPTIINGMHFINSAARAPKECSILLVLLFISQTEAFTWIQEPDNPTIVIEDGISNKNVRLVWTFALESNEDTVEIFIHREDLDGANRVDIASRRNNTGFTYRQNSDFYKAELPYQLLILNVNNVKEYKYGLGVVFVRSGSLKSAASTVHVKVYVPPRITVPPARTSRVDAGQNLTLMCNASGDPTPNITWTREGATQANQLVNATGYRLYLVNVQKGHVGLYRCTASNGYGTVSSLALVNVRCPSNQCDLFTVGITILGMEFKDAFRNKASVEYQQLASNVTSAIAGVYTKFPQKELYELAIEEFKNGSTGVVAIVQLLFGDPLQPLQNGIIDGKLGTLTVVNQLDINLSTTMRSATPSGATPKTQTNSSPSDTGMTVIIGGCIALILATVM